MKLSIIVTCYNLEKYIDRCINSIVPQLTDETELIIVNDGSKDDSLRILEKLASLTPTITVINQPNRGISSARNTGVEAAKGDFIWFIDGDDYILPDSVKILLSNITPLIDVIAFNYAVKTNTNTINLLIYNNELINAAELIRRESFFVWNRIYNRRIFEFVKFIEGLNNIEDTVFNILISKHIGKIKTLSQILYVYEKTNASSISMSRSKRHLISLYKDTLKAQKILQTRHNEIKNEEIKSEWEKALNKTYVGNAFSLLRFYNCKYFKKGINLYEEWGVYPFKNEGNIKMRAFVFLINHKSLWFTHKFLKRFIPR